MQSGCSLCDACSSHFQPVIIEMGLEGIAPLASQSSCHLNPSSPPYCANIWQLARFESYPHTHKSETAINFISRLRVRTESVCIRGEIALLVCQRERDTPFV